MKIAINCMFLQEKAGGIKEYIINLINNILIIDQENEFIVYVFKDQINYAKSIIGERVKIKGIPFLSNGIFNVIYRSLFQQRFWYKEEEYEKFDIFHSPFFYSPNFKNAKVILTVHDLRFCRYPHTYTFLRLIFLKYIVKRSIKQANHIISISSFTKDEIIDLYNVPESKITVVLEAVNFEKFRKNENKIEFNERKELQASRFLLTVGHLEPRKNYVMLINSFNKLKENNACKDLKLVIVGKKNHDFRETINLINTNKDIYYLSYVENNTLMWLYEHATLFVFPSIYEGFGFPPLEAACFNTVSVVSDVSSIPEICGDSCFYFNPFDKESIVKNLSCALFNEELYKTKLLAMQKNLQRFSWKSNAIQTLNIYYSVYNNE